jgi:hypothetical protein
VSARDRWLECRAAHYSHEQALLPVIDLVQRNLDIRDEHGPEERLALLRQGLDAAGIETGEAFTLVAALLTLPLAGLPELPPAPPASRRRKQIEILAEWVIGLSRLTPIVLAFEDLHWMDAASLEWLEVLGERALRERVLLVLTQRPQEPPDWAMRRGARVLNLARLEHADAVQLARSVAGDNEIPDDLLELIALRTDGIPLFIEELTHTMLDARKAGADAASLGRSIPDSLQASLTARLDAVGSAREAAQLGACLGREFRYDVLDAVWQKDPALLRAHVDRLVVSGLVFPRRALRETYLFKHALIRDSAYQSLLSSRRHELHGRIADALVEHFPEIAQSQPELLAHHYGEAKQLEPAVDFLHRAGLRERERFAHVEAVAHLHAALELLAKLPDAPENRSRELRIRVSLGRLLSSTAGYGAGELEANADQIGRLCEKIGDSPETFPALFNQWSFYMGQEDPVRMEGFAVRLLTIAQKMGDPGTLVETELAMGVTRLWQGDAEGCVAHLRHTVELYDAERDRHHVALYGQDPCAAALAVGGTALVTAGHLDVGIAWHERAQALAAKIDHAYTQAGCLAFYASARNQRREPTLALALGRRLLEISEERGFKLYRAGALAHVAGALVELGELDEGAARAIESSRGFEECRSHVGSLTPVVHLAKARLRQGDAAAGLAATARGRKLIERRIDPLGWPELLRIEAELLLLGSHADHDAAERVLGEALELSERQRAGLSGLVVATSLARLLGQRGRSDAARAVLAPRCAWFTNAGLDGLVVREAREVLQAL